MREDLRDNIASGSEADFVSRDRGIRHMKAFIVLAFFICPAFLIAQTQEFPEDSGNAFVRLCSAADEPGNSSFSNEQVVVAMDCMAYVRGVVDGIELSSRLAEFKTKQNALKLFCRPDNVEGGQMVRIVLRFIRDHPERAQFLTEILILKSMENAFPCAAK